MRARLHSVMPDYKGKLQKLCESMTPPSDENLGFWFRDVEGRLLEQAKQGRTTWRERRFPHLEQLCNNVYQFICDCPNPENASDILFKELNKFCQVFKDYWCAHSDVKLTVTDVYFVKNNGILGLQFEFDWTPTEAELKHAQYK